MEGGLHHALGYLKFSSGFQCVSFRASASFGNSRKQSDASCMKAKRRRPSATNQTWSMDFVADQLQDGSRFRSRNIVNVYICEAVAIEVGQSLKGDDAVRTLNKLKLEREVPKMLFRDNGSEFTSQIMDQWAYRNGAKIDFS